MAERLRFFPERPRARRYPWEEWVDGRPWKIERGQDYEVPTENMRVNLHVKAGSLGGKVKTQKVGDGLVFQFLPPKETEILALKAEEDPQGTEAALQKLYADACTIYEEARSKVTIQRSDGRRQRYAPIRFKQQIEHAAEAGELPQTVARIVRKATLGFGHLVEAGHEELLLETLVCDSRRPYHELFSKETVEIARGRLAALKGSGG